jgi:acetyl esterase/lipase
MGSNRIYREFAARLSRATKAAVLLVDYRLAPQDPFPAAVEDTLAVYSWLLSRGINRRQIMLSGDSAGGGLVVAALLALKERGVEPLAGAVCISPWVDLTLSGSTMAPGVVDDPLITHDNLAKMADAYAKNNLSHAWASPIRGNLAGLPPLCILVGTREILLDDARRLNAAAKSAGVQTDYLEAPGMVHCWPVLAALAPESAAALSHIGRFVEAHAAQ